MSIFGGVGKRLKSKWILAIYIAVIVIFAIIYKILPDEGFKHENSFSFWNCLYFSVVTITTLGYGEITPVTYTAKLLVSIQTLLGLLLLGLFLNGKAQEAVERNDEEKFDNAFKLSSDMLLFLEEYFLAALKKNIDKDKTPKERFVYIAKKLINQPEEFDFTDHILNNIYWGTTYAVNDFRLLALYSKNLNDETLSSISAIITNLDNIKISPIDKVSPRDRDNREPESFQHKASIIFRNAAVLCDLRKMNKALRAHQPPK